MVLLRCLHVAFCCFGVALALALALALGFGIWDWLWHQHLILRQLRLVAMEFGRALWRFFRRGAS